MKRLTVIVVAATLVACGGNDSAAGAFAGINSCSGISERLVDEAERLRDEDTSAGFELVLVDARTRIRELDCDQAAVFRAADAAIEELPPTPEQAVQSELRNLAVAMETYYTDYGTYAYSIPALVGLFTPTEGIISQVITADGQQFCIEATLDNLMWSYDSDGAIQLTEGPC